ncbi:MAG TPA: DUF1801 domain-containing protein [Thermomicrobiales bacterium]
MAKDPIESFIEVQAPSVQPVVRRLREVVKTTLPELNEYFDGHGVIRYGRGSGMRDWVCYISGHRAHANLGFARGASLPDPEGLIEGTGKNLRHVKVRLVEDAERAGLRGLLEAAGRIEGEG